jgi:hypothetical protein
MTKKDYTLIAYTIQQVRKSYAADRDPNLFRCCDDMSRAFASILANDNPRFDRGRFMDACGFGAKGDESSPPSDTELRQHLTRGVR